MYAKVFSQIFTSSIAKDRVVRYGFMDLLVLADRDGVVDMTPEAIARVTNVPEEIVLSYLAELQKPDTRSRTPDEDGCRIVLLEGHRDWGWSIVNYSRYRDLNNDEARREYFREAQRKRRSNIVKDSQRPLLTPEYEYESENQSSSKKKAIEIPTWIPADAWQGFVEMRQKIRAPLTERAARLTISKLETLKAEGNEPGAVLDQSTQNDWRGVFPLRTNGNGNGQALPERTKVNQAALDGFREYEARRNGESDSSDSRNNRRKIVGGGPDSVR